MHSNNRDSQAPKIEFEPSDLVEYGDVREQTQGGGGPPAVPDGAVYNS